MSFLASVLRTAYRLVGAKKAFALPEEEHVSPAAKRFITYALDRLPELDVL